MFARRWPFNHGLRKHRPVFGVQIDAGAINAVLRLVAAANTLRLASASIAATATMATADGHVTAAAGVLGISAAQLLT